MWEKISNKIKKKLTPGDVIFLYGEIGVGKTTFARLLINNYENEKNLKSHKPTHKVYNLKAAIFSKPNKKTQGTNTNMQTTLNLDMNEINNEHVTDNEHEHEHAHEHEH